ncbi:hypothetical protein LC55x_3385 [Lysobacter capsici]|nr:hypothetical protein LC55x_3385 [Lysobacter capsici]
MIANPLIAANTQHRSRGPHHIRPRIRHNSLTADTQSQ